MSFSNEIIALRVKDIRAIDFGSSIPEISASLSMVLSLYEIDDDPTIIGECKNKLEEGVERLEVLGAGDEASQFKPE